MNPTDDITDDEFALIERFFAAGQGRARADVLLGIGDDCALLAAPPSGALAVSIDLLVVGHHFLPEDEPEAIGHKALAVNLSDLAAVGAEAAWVTLGLSLPQPDEVWLAGFCRGFFALAERHRVSLVGGDTTRGPLCVAVQAHGFVEPELALRRSGARPGDLLFVTGTLGDAALALAGAGLKLSGQQRRALGRRLQRPTPRLQQGRDLRGIASAAIDISDGLAQDLGHILKASGVGATLWPERLPLSPTAQALEDRTRALQAALSGGDDYELCFTVAPERLPALRKVAAGWSCAYTECGRIEAEAGLRLADSRRPLTPGGYRHFA